MPDNKNNDPNNVNSGAEPDETDGSSSYLTSEQFNKAMSARERAFEKKISKLMEENRSLLDRIAPPKEEPQLSRTAELEKTVKDLSRQLQERDSREKASNLRKTAESTLRAHGIDAEFTDHALAYLVDAKQAIRYDEDGNVIMVLNGMTYENLDEGVAAWSQSRDAKLYKKPTAAQGSGDGNRRNLNPGSLDSNGKFEIKRQQDADKNFNPHNPKSSLDRNSKVALSQLLAQKLIKR